MCVSITYSFELCFVRACVAAIVSNVNDRFQQEGYKMVMDLENLLLKCALGQDYMEEFETVTKFYGYVS